MRKIIALVFILSAFSMYAQNEEEETLFGSGDDVKFGLYAGPEFKLTSFNGELGFMTGGKAGLILDRVFSIGGGGYNIVTNHKVYDSDEVDAPWVDLDFSYGGIIFEYINDPNKLYHFTGSLLLGAGYASYSGDVYGFPEDVDWYRKGATYFVAEPQINVDVNLIKYLRLGVGASYRFAVGGDLEKTSATDLSGVSLNLSIRAYVDDLNHIIKKIEKQVEDL